MLSARGRHRVLRVARTIADLGGREQVSRADVLTALSLRQRSAAERRSLRERGGGRSVNEADACDKCLARTWLLARLAGHVDRHRDRLDAVLELGAGDLIAALAGKRRTAVERELDSFDPEQARRQAAEAGLELICRCHVGYPRTLAELSAPPAVLHVAGGLERFLALAAHAPVGIVGARRASPYGLDVARSLARRAGGAPACRSSAGWRPGSTPPPTAGRST